MRKFIVLLLLLSAFCVEVNAQYMTARSIVVIKDKSRQKKDKEQANSDAEKEAFEEWKQQMQEKQAQLLNDKAAEEEARIAAEKEATAKAEAERKAAEEKARIVAEKETAVKAESERKAQEQAKITAEKEAEAKAKAEKQAQIAAQKEAKAIERKRKGYNQLVDLSYSYCSVTDFLGVNYIGGYRFNPYIFLGLGTGINIALFTPDASKLDLPFCKPSVVNIPVYIHFKANFTKSDWSPYISVSAGARISPFIQKGAYYAYNQSGFLGGVKFGVDRAISKKLSLYFGVGYRIESYLYCKFESIDELIQGHKLLHGFSAHLGLSF